MSSAGSETANVSNNANPHEDLMMEAPISFKSPLAGISSLPMTREKHETPHKLDINQKSPDNYGHFRYHQWQEPDIGDIRHQLLLQRTFNNHDDHPEPRTTSPLRKIRICTVASGIQTVTVSPSRGTIPHCSRSSGIRETNSYQRQPHPGILSPFLQSPNVNTISAHEIQTFKTPNRNQHLSHPNNSEIGISHPLTPSMMSPASTPSYAFTPGRQFCNPFEIGHDRMQMPIYSPNMFKVTGSVNKSTKKEKESFWSVEHSALMMPVDIKEAEIRHQHRYQQRIDREQDARLQSAINKFFSNEHIAPSPWSEKIKHILPCTPGAVRSVSSQTVMSVPPHVDLFAKLEEYKTEPSPASDSFGSSFIRRKLLNQLNDNDSELFSSPAILSRGTGEVIDSPSPIKQTTPEWEKSTPNKGGAGAGHFSSSPIRQGPSDYGRHHALYDSNLLASPELSPIAGRTMKSVRSSMIFYSEQDESSPRAVMQLDFSSILDDPEEAGSDKLETLIHKGASSNHYMDSVTKSETLSASGDHQFLASNISHDSDGNSNNSKLGIGQFHRSTLMSAESTSDIVATVPQSQSSQDTGYQTASLQTTNHESAPNSNITSQEIAPLTSSIHSTDLRSFPVAFSSDLFADLKERAFSTDTPNDAVKLRYKSNSSFDANGSFLGFAFESSKQKSSSADDVALIRKKDETCRVRKVRTISDMRYLKEKSSVSRDLIQSFNEEKERSGSSTSTHSPWLDLNSDTFVPIANKIIGSSQQTTFCRDYQTVGLKRPDDNDNAHDVPNDFDVSMRSTYSYFNLSLEKKVLNVSSVASVPEKMNISYEHIVCGEQHPKFSFHDDGSLQAARLLLDKSEELRNRIIQPKPLESDSLYQAISSYVEHKDPLTKHSFLLPLLTTNPRSLTPSLERKPGDSYSPTSQMLDSVKKKIDQVEGSKLGSEIAAEILKRAGEDLAMLTNILSCEKQ